MSKRGIIILLVIVAAGLILAVTVPPLLSGRMLASVLEPAHCRTRMWGHAFPVVAAAAGWRRMGQGGWG